MYVGVGTMALVMLCKVYFSLVAFQFPTHMQIFYFVYFCKCMEPFFEVFDVFIVGMLIMWSYVCVYIEGGAGCICRLNCTAESCIAEWKVDITRKF